MHQGYCKKTCTLRFTCSKLTVDGMIATLPTEEDRTICLTAFTYFHQSQESRYKHHFHLQNDLEGQGKEPLPYTISSIHNL